MKLNERVTEILRLRHVQLLSKSLLFLILFSIDLLNGVYLLQNVAEINFLMNGNYLPEVALQRLTEYLSPLERLKLQQCCKYFHKIYGNWSDIVALDIRIVEQNGNKNFFFAKK